MQIIFTVNEVLACEDLLGVNRVHDLLIVEELSYQVELHFTIILITKL